MSIDWSKPVRRVNREDNNQDKYRVLCTDRKGDSPIIILNETSGCVFSVTLDGHYIGGRTPIFENIPETVEIDVWINVYEGGVGWLHTTRASADEVNSSPRRIACINVKRTVEVGEGLNK